MSKLKIVLAEDEPALGQIVKESLTSRGFEVLLCTNGVEAFEAYLNERPSIMVLDVMMPIKDGFTVARELRAIDQDIPILFLTAKSQVADVVTGFSIGGNDYLKKPFSIEELIVRIHNLVKTSSQSKTTQIAIGNYLFDFSKQELSFRESVQKLTHREAHLLFHLVKNKNQVLDRKTVLKELWGNDDFFNGRSMDVFITKLRKKLKQDADVQIVNVRGYGYKIIC